MCFFFCKRYCSTFSTNSENGIFPFWQIHLPLPRNEQDQFSSLIRGRGETRLKKPFLFFDRAFFPLVSHLERETRTPLMRKCYFIIVHQAKKKTAHSGLGLGIHHSPSSNFALSCGIKNFGKSLLAARPRQEKGDLAPAVIWGWDERRRGSPQQQEEEELETTTGVTTDQPRMGGTGEEGEREQT